jgi:serine/threonine protein kinase
VVHQVCYYLCIINDFFFDFSLIVRYILGYVAPEIIKREPYGLGCDIWSIGIIAYILLGGYPPFNEPTQKVLFEKIKAGKYEFHYDYWKDVSNEAKDFISKLLVVDQKKRYTVSSLQNY